MVRFSRFASIDGFLRLLLPFLPVVCVFVFLHADNSFVYTCVCGRLQQVVRVSLFAA